MKPLPDVDDQAAMIVAGQRAVLQHARNEACQALRDAMLACQSAKLEHVDQPARDAMVAAHRLLEVFTLWCSLKSRADAEGMGAVLPTPEGRGLGEGAPR